MKYALAISLFLLGCTDADMGYLSSYGDSADVKCYSGGQIVYEGKTTGKVGSLQGGGWAFKTLDNTYVQTFADCFVSYKY